MKARALEVQKARQRHIARIARRLQGTHDPMSCLIQQDRDSYNVWISLPGQHPIDDSFGFVAGCGPDRDAAVREAVSALEDVIDRLQGPSKKVNHGEEFI